MATQETTSTLERLYQTLLVQESLLTAIAALNPGSDEANLAHLANRQCSEVAIGLRELIDEGAEA